MTPSENCFKLIKEFEGLVLHAYPDPATKAEPFTIGWGTTIYKDGTKVKLGDTITEQVADDNLEFEVNKKALSVNTLTKEIPLSQNQFDALVSFAYNCGLGNFQKSTLLKKVKVDPNDPLIGNEFMKWNKANGHEMKGLTRRRQAEVKLYFT